MSTPEIITVNSEALEAQVRDLLPSQNGFGSELQASNVIMPIIDLTATAEGSGLDVSLQQAFSFGSQTSATFTTGTTTAVSTTGFYRIAGVCNITGTNAAVKQGTLQLNDGSTTKELFSFEKVSGAVFSSYTINPFDFVIFLSAGESLEVVCNSATIQLTSRQIATITGELVNPAGFVAE